MFTFAVLLQGVAVVTGLAVLAAGSHGVVVAAQTLPRQAVAGVALLGVDVVVAGTLLAAGAWQRQVAIETRAAPVAARA